MADVPRLSVTGLCPQAWIAAEQTSYCTLPSRCRLMHAGVLTQLSSLQAVVSMFMYGALTSKHEVISLLF